MSNIRSQMQALLDENSEEQIDLNAKQVVAQLVLAMQAVGLDPKDDEQLDQFMKLLKTLATTKAQMVKSSIKNWSGAKASKAFRAAKKAV